MELPPASVPPSPTAAATPPVGRDEPTRLELAAELAPELFACLHWVTSLAIRYPVGSPEELISALEQRIRPRQTSDAAPPLVGATFGRGLLKRYFLREFFPLRSPNELLSRAYIAVMDSGARRRIAHRKGMEPGATTGPAQSTEIVFSDVPVFCEANRWTKVLASPRVVARCAAHFSKLDAQVQWRRYSTVDPFFDEGTHATLAPYHAMLANEPAVEFWFQSPVDIVVSWTGHAARRDKIAQSEADLLGGQPGLGLSPVEDSSGEKRA